MPAPAPQYLGVFPLLTTLCGVTLCFVGVTQHYTVGGMMKRGSTSNRDRGGASSNREGVNGKPTRAITYYVTPEDEEAIKEAAKRERISVSAFSRRAATRDAEA